MPEATTAAATTATTTAATATAATTTSAAEWYQGADSAIIGHLQTHGWDKKTPAEAALEAAKSHFNLQKLTGVPADRLAKIPDAADSEGWKAFYQKLGAPADPKAYDFKAIKFSNGDELDEKFTDWLRSTAADLNLRPQDALKWAQSVVKHMDEADAQELAETSANAQKEMKALQDNWGANYDANMVIARLFAQNHKINAGAIDVLQKMDGVGYAGVMELFRSLAVATGEANFIGTRRPGGNGPMTRDEASARKEELMSDPAWKSRYLAGDKAALNDMLAVNALISGRAA